MDQSKFDILAEMFAAGVSRRSTLGLLGGALGLAFSGEVLEAAKRGKRRRRRQDKRKRRRNQDSSGGGGGQNPPKSVCEAAGTRTCDVSALQPGADMSQCDLAGAGLVGAQLTGAAADQVSFKGAHLLAVNLTSASLARTCFAGASLRNAELRSTNLINADFTDADLCGADMRNSNVKPSQLTAAQVCCGTLLSDGSSAAPCRAGTTCCENGCVDLDSNPYNCGACGQTCDVGEICCSGHCATPSATGMCDESTAECLTPEDDLQAAFDAANPGDVVLLCKGTWHIENTLTIDSEISIVGGFDGGISEIDAGFNCQVFGISWGVLVTMTNVAVHGGQAGNGAGIFNQGHLTMGDCNVNDNSAINWGGGIYNEGTLRLVRGYVQSNTAFNEDFGYGGLGLYNDEGTVIIEEASISYNQQDRTFNAGYGGGIYNYYGQVDLSPESLVTGNELHGSGGGLYNQGGLNEIAATNIIVDNHPDNCAGDSTFNNCTG